MPSNQSPHLINPGDRFYRLVVTGFSHQDKRWRRHYFVQCDCGRQKTVQGTLLRSGNTRSCGCLSREVKKLYRGPNNQAEVTAVILGYKRHAKGRGLNWELSREQTAELLRRNCEYCGEPPSNRKVTKNSLLPFFYSGIDRVDNTKGYSLSNTVACCTTCNRAKGVLTVGEFKKWVTKCSEKLRSNHAVEQTLMA